MRLGETLPGARFAGLTADAATQISGDFELPLGAHPCGASAAGDDARTMRIIAVAGAGGESRACALIRDIFETAGLKTGIIPSIPEGGGDEGSLGARSTELRRALGRMAEEGCRFAVAEISPGALDAELFRDVGIFQCVHMGTEKHPELMKNSEVSIVDMDSPGAAELMGGAGRIYTYSAKSDAADLSARDIKLHSSHVSFCALMTGKLEKLRVAGNGMDAVYDALASAAAAVNAGIGLSTVRDALEGTYGAENTHGGSMR